MLRHEPLRPMFPAGPQSLPTAIPGAQRLAHRDQLMLGRADQVGAAHAAQRVALRPRDLKTLLSRINSKTRILIQS